jgi:hypothetical protein
MRTIDTGARRFMLVVFALASLTACGADNPTASDRVPPRDPAPTPKPPVPTFPPLSCIGAVYDRVSASTVPGTSAFIVCLNGSFVLYYERPDGSFNYAGTYVSGSSGLTFKFDSSSAAGPWTATGIVVWDSLTVKYNEVMKSAAFEDGVYRARPSPWDY